MARLRFYADASALIGLARIGRLDLLTLLPTPIYITARVWAEVAGDLTKAGVGNLYHAREEGLLAVVDEGDPEAFPRLDPGESTVLSAAASARAAVLIDERRSRSLVNTDRDLRRTIRLATGILGLILARRSMSISCAKPVSFDVERSSLFHLAEGTLDTHGPRQPG